MSAAYRVYVGCYTRKENHVDGKGKGIAVFRFNAKDGSLTPESLPNHVFPVGENPTYTCTDAKFQHLYVVNEIGEGTVGAYAINGDGSLTHINTAPTKGGSPCHLTLDATQRFLFIANYMTGSVIYYPRKENGAVGEPVELIQHKGSSVNPARQEGPHAHGVVFDSSNKYLFVPDLGIDQVVQYVFDSASGKVSPNLVAPALNIEKGQGPRHFVFHPSGRFAYVVNELLSTVVACKFDSSNGTLTSVQQISTLPSDFTGVSTCAAIRVSASGKFVYASNRGHDSIAVFKVDPETGLLAAVGHTSTGGKVPRDFIIDPTGTILLAANQNTDNIRAYFIDQETGQLTFTGAETITPTPVSFEFVPIK